MTMESSYPIYLAMIISVTTTVGSAHHPVTAYGAVRCRLHGSYQPVPEVRIKLMDDDLLVDDTMATGKTNTHGRFYLHGTGRDIFGGKPDPKMRIEYVYNGKEGNIEIEGAFLNRKDESGTKPYSTVVNFGNLDFDNPHCRAYVRFYRVLKEYYALGAGRTPYSKLHVKTNALIHGGTPYATTNVIRIPKSWDPISLSTARHEFAHTIRHSYDGSLAHFLADVVKYGYARKHHCHLKTNLAFAYNEGWAQYYAGECTGNKGTDYTIEGNVATALRRLAQKCRSSKGRMVAVLKRAGPESVHSFQEFNAKHQQFYNCKL
jgi:hypothetical protein